MLLDDFISSQSSTPPIVDQIAQHFLPNSYGVAPQPPANNTNTMQVGPPPVTRLVPDNLAAAARLPAMSSADRIETIKSLLCSESGTEVGSALKPLSLPAAQSKPALSRIAGAVTAAPFTAIPHTLPRMSSRAANISTTTATTLGDYRSPHPYHTPLMIKIPTKVRLPPQKDGKKINQHTYKSHAPGDGLLKIDNKSEMPASLVPVSLVPTERPYQSTIMTDHGILNIISSNEPGAKVPTPPASYISVNSNSTGASSSSVAPSSLVSTTSSEEQYQAAMAVTSLSLSQSSSSNGAKPKRTRNRGGKKRTSFSRNHIYAMEKRFDQQRYLTSVERKEFSNSIGLDDQHVKIWFQNRRSKLKRQSLGLVSSSSVTVRSNLEIRAKPPTGPIDPPPSQHINGHVLPSYVTSSSVHYQPAVPAQMTSSNPTPATVYYQHGSIPPYTAASMMPPHGGTGVPYPNMNSTASSVPSSYSSTVPTGANAYAPMSQMVSAAPAPGSFAHPYAPQYSDANQNVMMSSAATHGHLPTSATKTNAMQAASTVSSVPFQPVYGYAHDFGVDQGAAYAAGQGSRSSSPFANFPFSPGFSVPEDAVANSFHNHMPIMPPVNMV